MVAFKASPNWRVKKSARHLALAAKVLVSDDDLVYLSELCNASEKEAAPDAIARELHSMIPQAGIEEFNLEEYANKNWRREFTQMLSGAGLELGALHRPMPQHPKMQVSYVDRFGIDELRKHYEELDEYDLVGPDIIDDAQTLASVADESQDFVIASHIIEHLANPIAAIEQWLRVLRPGGHLYLVTPDKRETFDRHRVRTTVEHLILDYLRPSAERDYEHFLDYAIHVNHKRGEAALREAERLIYEGYSIHYHVFMPSDVKAMITWLAKNVTPVKIARGPCMAPGSDEFHLLIEKA